MKRRFVSVFILLTFLAAVAAAFYVQREWNRPYPATRVRTMVQIPRGLGAHDVLELLENKRVIRNRHVALLYLLYTGNRHQLQAGEYLFDRPMTATEVLGKIVSGSVYLYRFTVPEGLTVEETAQQWEEQGFGEATDFLAAAQRAVEIVRRFDPEADSVEGYLFPETYSFPANTSADQVTRAMIQGFGRTLERLRAAVPVTDWPLNVRETVILASLVESEASHEEERALVASVFLNRLDRRFLLQCDPTVVYALQKAKQYRGTLTRADLRFDSPYNTYLYPGLPPGPIASPGYESLLATVQPAVTSYLYFVRTTGGRHRFSENLADHNRAVQAYRRSLRNANR